MTDPITPVLTRRWAEPRSWSIDTYERTGGYQAFRDALRADPDELIQLVKTRDARPPRLRLPHRHEVGLSSRRGPPARAPSPSTS